MKKSERTEVIQKFLDRDFPNPGVPLNHDDAYTLLIAVLLSAQCTDERCGLGPQKSKAIKNLSKILVDEHDGKVPDDLASLEKLPGVGHKTASVVISQAFNIPAFPVDTHIHRCAQRWGLSNGRSVQQTERDLKKLFPSEKWNKLHIQIIMYARSYCPARGCFGLECSICKTCYPNRKSKFKHKKP